jgi:hypothetical protein
MPMNMKHLSENKMDPRAQTGGVRHLDSSRTRTTIPWRAAALERGKPTFGFFETLQSRYGDGWS